MKMHYLLLSSMIVVLLGCLQKRLPNALSLQQIISVVSNSQVDFQWSPDESMIAYTFKYEEVIVAATDSTGTQIIAESTPDIKYFHPLWAPDSSKLLYHWLNETQSCPANDWTWERKVLRAKSFAYEMEEAASISIRSHIVPLFDAIHSPDQERLEKPARKNLEANPDDNSCLKLVVYDLATGDSEMIGIEMAVIDWFPDGHRLLGAIQDDDVRRLAIFDLTNHIVTYQSEKRFYDLTVNAIPRQSGAVSPNGQCIVYAVDDDGARDQGWIVCFDEHGQRNKTIIIESANSEHYVWSPDSRELAYFRLEVIEDPFSPRSTLTIYNYSLENEETSVLAEIEVPGKQYHWPTWSPDGRFIALTASADIVARLNNPESIGLNSLVLVDMSNGDHMKYDFSEIDGSPTWLRWGEQSDRVYLNGEEKIMEFSFP